MKAHLLYVFPHEVSVAFDASLNREGKAARAAEAISWIHEMGWKFEEHWKFVRFGLNEGDTGNVIVGFKRANDATQFKLTWG